MAGELMGHRGETTILILLNGHSIKLASTFLSPFPLLVQLSDSEKFPRGWYFTAETYKWFKYRDEVPVECSAIIVASLFHTPSPSRLRNHYG